MSVSVRVVEAAFISSDLIHFAYYFSFFCWFSPLDCSHVVELGDSIAIVEAQSLSFGGGRGEEARCCEEKDGEREPRSAGRASEWNNDTAGPRMNWIFERCERLNKGLQIFMAAKTKPLHKTHPAGSEEKTKKFTLPPTRSGRTRRETQPRRKQPFSQIACERDLLCVEPHGFVSVDRDSLRSETEREKRAEKCEERPTNL